MHHPKERRINYAQSSRHEYNLTDHLGNTRVCFTPNPANPTNIQPKILQQTNYYAYGLPIGYLSRTYPLSGTMALEQKYQYNQKELNSDFGLLWSDYGARWLDLQRGVWGQIDPLAEKYAAWSGYNYVVGNPIRLIDPDGRDTSFANNEARTQFKQVVTEVTNSVEDLKQKIAAAEKKGENGKNVAKKLAKLNTKLAEIEKIKIAFDEIASSKVMFYYDAIPNPNGTASNGHTGFNHNTNRIEITFYSGCYSTIVHESRHGAGYHRGEWSTVPDPTGSDLGVPVYYDYQDEYEGYVFQNIYTSYFESPSTSTPYSSDQAIRDVITQNYSSKNFIIKEFIQHYVPK